MARGARALGGKQNLRMGFPSFRSMEIPEERTALDDFMEKWEQELAEKRAVEESKRQEAVAAAAKALDEHKKQADIARQKRYETNRNSEQVKLEQLESEGTGNPWDRVVGLIDVTSQDSSVANTSRMKSVIIQVKNKPLEGTRALEAAA
eukprot:scaffold952_cov249-Pinguiococcus_pyrenoidosus.AAC.10